MAFWPRPRPKAAICQRRTPNGNRLDRPDGLSTRVVTGGRARLVSMIRAVFLGMLCASIALPAAADEPAAGGGLIYELKIGAQVHDVPYMWSGFHVERYAADLNLEAMFSPPWVLQTANPPSLDARPRDTARLGQNVGEGVRRTMRWRHRAGGREPRP